MLSYILYHRYIIWYLDRYLQEYNRQHHNKHHHHTSPLHYRNMMALGLKLKLASWKAQRRPRPHSSPDCSIWSSQDAGTGRQIHRPPIASFTINVVKWTHQFLCKPLYLPYYTCHIYVDSTCGWAWKSWKIRQPLLLKYSLARIDIRYMGSFMQLYWFWSSKYIVNGEWWRGKKDSTLRT